MGLFRKKINEERARDFFLMAYTQTLSKEEMADNVEKLDKLKEALPLLKDVKQQTFNRNISAVNLDWLAIAWTKYYYPRGVNIVDAVMFDTELKKEIAEKVPGYKVVEPLISMYSQSHQGSSDMNTDMAYAFVAEIMGDEDFNKASETDPDELRQTILAISGLFVGTYDLYRSMFKKSKLLK